jgi:LEA14-like dessication related protein
MRLQVAIEVFNPNKYKIKLKSYDLKVFLNGKEAGDVYGKETQLMAANATTMLRFSLDSDLGKILGGLAGLAGGLFGGKKGVDLRVTGKLRARALGIGKTIPIDFSNFVAWKDMGL